MSTSIAKHLVRRSALVMALLLLLALPVALGEASSPFSGGDGTAASPYGIETAQQLDAVRDYMSDCFILLADIDLSTYGNWMPIGAFVAKDATAGDYAPDLDAAFTGSFDGNSHTLSGLTIARDDVSTEDMSGTGLFGGIAGEATIFDLILEDATVSSTGNCVAALVGMAMSSNERAIQGITLQGTNSIAGPGSVAGLVGSAQDTNILDCAAMADVVMTAVGNGAGILGGGLEGGILSGCTATGTVTATQTMEYEGVVIGPVGIGGLAGCAFEAKAIEDCVAKNATLTVGEHAAMVGGLVGYTGIVNEGPFATEPEGFTCVRNCQVEQVTIEAGSGATRIGGLVGSGFCGSSYNSYYPATSAIHIVGCTASGTMAVADDALAGSILGYAYQNCAVVSCDGSDMAGVTHQVGAADAGQVVALSDIK